MDESLFSDIVTQCMKTLRLDADDTDEQDFVSILVQDGVDFLKQIISEDIDFSNGFEKSLLKDRVRYAYNSTIEDFVYNFLTEIESLQVKYAKSTLKDL